MLLALQGPRAGTRAEAVNCRNVIHPHHHVWRAGEEELFWFCLLKRDCVSVGAHYRQRLDLWAEAFHKSYAVLGNVLIFSTGSPYWSAFNLLLKNLYFLPDTVERNYKKAWVFVFFSSQFCHSATSGTEWSCKWASSLPGLWDGCRCSLPTWWVLPALGGGRSLVSHTLSQLLEVWG